MLPPKGREGQCCLLQAGWRRDSTAPYRPGESVLSPASREEDEQSRPLQAGRKKAMLPPRGREEGQCCPL